MKQIQFHVGSIPPTPNFEPDERWTRLREPEMWLFQLVATFIGLAAAAGAAWLWFRLTPLDRFGFEPTLGTALILFGTVALVIFVHELLHAAAHPKFAENGYTIIGFWPAKVVFFAAYLGPTTRNRFLFGLLLPLIVISLIPLILATLVLIPSSMLAFISIVNVALASGDIFGAYLVLTQIPSGATLCSQGHITYWQMASHL